MRSMQRIGWIVRCAVALGLVVLASHSLLGVSDGDGLGHDESIALLSMAGHQMDLGRLKPQEIQPLAAIQEQTQLAPDRGLAELARGLRGSDFHPPLYFVLGRLWLQAGGLFGASAYPPASARGIDVRLTRLSSLLLVLAVLLLALSGVYRRDEVGLAHLAAAALLPTVPYLTSQGFNCRPYALLILLTVLAWVLLVERVSLAEENTGSDDAQESAKILRFDLAIGLVLGLGLLTHYLFLFYAFGVLIGLVWTGRRGLISAVRAGLVTTAVFGPWLLFVGKRSFTPPGHLRKETASAEVALERIERLLRDYLSLGDAFPTLPAWLLPAVLSLGVLALLCHKNGCSRALAAVLALPFLGPLLVDLFVGRSLLAVDRVAVAAVPLLLWGLCWLMANLPRRIAPMLLAILSICAIYASPGHSFDSNRYIQGGNVVQQVLGGAEQPRLLVVTTADARGQLLRRTRYLPREADLAFVPANELARSLPTLAVPYTHLYVLGVPRPYGGRQKYRRKHAEAYDKALKAAGWKRVKSKKRRRNGWALYARGARGN